MLAVFLITGVYILFVWAVFFRLRWLRFTPAWAIISGFFLLHLVLVPIVGLRFTAPPSFDARIVQPTIQITPRLSEPTLVTEVLVEPNVEVKKGTVLFRFDKTIYEARAKMAAAQLAAARQNVGILAQDVDIARDKVARDEAEIAYASAEAARYTNLAKNGAAATEDVQKWDARLRAVEADLAAAKAELERAKLAYTSEIDGVNTAVAEAEARLAEAAYYLEHTEIVAPEDGMVSNLQVRPGMVAGDVRFGAIASFIASGERYLLVTYTQEFLRFVVPGQAVEFALDMYPGEIFNGTVDSVWWANGNGQLLPSGTLPTFQNPDPTQSRFAVRVTIDPAITERMPIGAMGAATVYTGGGGFADLGRIGIRTYSWFNWLYPLPF